MMKPLPLLALLVCYPIAEADEVMPSAKFQEQTSKPIPNADLPSHIHPDPGSEISLVADYGAKVAQGIPLYVINSSDQGVDLPTQDGDLFIRLEAKLPEGEWRRAQAHISSWCGNSYYALSLKPGEHVRLFGYVPENGLPGEIRYTFYRGDSISTASHQGLYLPADIEDAHTDEMSIWNVPRTLYPDSVHPNLLAKDGFLEKLLSDARETTGLFTTLTLWKHFGEIPRTAAVAERLRLATTSNAGEDESVRDNVTRLREIIDSPPHPEASASHLAGYCISKINHRDPKEWLDERMLWETLAGLCELNLIPEDMQKQITRLAIERRHPILFGDRVVNFATTADLWSLVSGNSADPYIRYMAFSHLLLAGFTTEVVTFAMKGSPEDREVVAKLLSNSYNDKIPKAPQKLAVVKDLYMKAIRETPGKSSALVNTEEFKVNPESFDFLAPVALESLEAEMEKSANLGNDYELPPGGRGWALLPELAAA